MKHGGNRRINSSNCCGGHRVEGSQASGKAGCILTPRIEAQEHANTRDRLVDKSRCGREEAAPNPTVPQDIMLRYT